MSTHQTPDGRWYVKYYIRHPGTEKKDKIKKEYFGRGKAAEQQAQDRDRELKLTGQVNDYTAGARRAVSTTLNDLAAEYLASKRNDMSVKSYKNLFSFLSSTILPELGHTEITRLSKHRLDQYVTKRLKTPVYKLVGRKSNQKKKPVTEPDGSVRMVSKSSVHRELSIIQAVINWGVKNDIVRYNPVAGHAKPKRDDEVIMPPTAQEIRAILSHASPHLKRGLLINYYSGLRPGEKELAYMSWFDIDWEENLLLVRSAEKGGPVRRQIVIHPELMELFRQWREEDRNNMHPYIIHWNGEPVKSLKKSFNAAKRRAGITRRLRLYDFRHKAITSILEHGGDLKSTSIIAGHSDTQMTTRIYQHVSRELMENTIRKIPKIEIE